MSVTALAMLVPLTLAGITALIVIDAWPSLRAFGISYVTTAVWDPVHLVFGAAAYVYGTIVTTLVAVVLAAPVAIGASLFLTEFAPRRIRGPVAYVIELLAYIPSIVYGLWAIFVMVPVMREHVEPALQGSLGQLPIVGALFRGTPVGLDLLSGGVVLAITEKIFPQILTSWDRLQRLLRETVPAQNYHLGCNFERVEQDGSEVVVHFGGGRRERADLVIGADGIRSGVRAQVAPQVQPIYAGYYIWRGAPNEADLASETLASIFPCFTFYLPERQQVIGYPIAGLDNDLTPGHRRYNFIWYRVGDDKALREMCVDANGHQHDYSVPPPLIRKDLIESMYADAEEELPPAFLDVLRKIERPFFTPIYDFSSPQLVFGRTILLGDAASSARPHMGFGVAKAGDDARALADALAAHDDIDKGLGQYQAVRAPMAERIMQHGRKLGTHLGVNLATDEDRRMWKMLQDYRAMMDWVAVPNFLAA